MFASIRSSGLLIVACLLFISACDFVTASSSRPLKQMTRTELARREHMQRRLRHFPHRRRDGQGPMPARPSPAWNKPPLAPASSDPPATSASSDPPVIPASSNPPLTPTVCDSCVCPPSRDPPATPALDNPPVNSPASDPPVAPPLNNPPETQAPSNASETPASSNPPSTPDAGRKFSWCDEEGSVLEPAFAHCERLICELRPKSRRLIGRRFGCRQRLCRRRQSEPSDLSARTQLRYTRPSRLAAHGIHVRRRHLLNATGLHPHVH